MCTDPKKAFQIGFTKNGKPSYLICDRHVHHLEKNHKGYYDKIYDWKISPGCEGAITDFIEVPCGVCEEDRLLSSKIWADRCLLEMKYHKSSLFITLTYDDDKVPKHQVPDKLTGEMTDDYALTLDKRDLQLFIKRLRKKFNGKKLRYFACGEYGSPSIENNFKPRPHYHLIVFGLELPDMVDLWTSDLGFPYYTSKTLNELWTNGFITVTPATYETCAYTARYVMKKVHKELKNFYIENNIVPEFCTMSRKPGIGRNYFDDNPYELYENLSISISTANGARKISRNRYFDKLMDIYDPIMLDIVKKTSIDFALDREKLKLSKTSLDKNEQLDVDEYLLHEKLKSLTRKEI